MPCAIPIIFGYILSVAEYITPGDVHRLALARKAKAIGSCLYAIH